MFPESGSDMDLKSKKAINTQWEENKSHQAGKKVRQERSGK